MLLYGIHKMYFYYCTDHSYILSRTIAYLFALQLRWEIPSFNLCCDYGYSGIVTKVSYDFPQSLQEKARTVC